MNRRLALTLDLGPAAAATGHFSQQLDKSQALLSSPLWKSFSQQIKSSSRRKEKKKKQRGRHQRRENVGNNENFTQKRSLKAEQLREKNMKEMSLQERSPACCQLSHFFFFVTAVQRGAGSRGLWEMFH